MATWQAAAAVAQARASGEVGVGSGRLARMAGLVVAAAKQEVDQEVAEAEVVKVRLARE